MAIMLGAAAALAAALSGVALAGDITVARPWGRASIGAGKASAVYLTVLNRGGAADRLIGAASPLAERVELHLHRMDGAVMQMRRVDAVDLPAGGTVVFEPGGLHIMLFGLEEPLRAGMTLPLTLQVESGGTIDVRVPIGPAGASGPPDE